MPLPHNIERVLESVLGADGHLDRAIRVAAADRAAAAGGGTRDTTDIPDPLRPYVDKITETPYKVVDADVASLKNGGLSEDQIFELTVATALGAASGRLEKVLGLLDEKSSCD